MHIACVIFDFVSADQLKICKFYPLQKISTYTVQEICACSIRGSSFLTMACFDLTTVLSHSQMHTHNTDQQPSPGHMVQRGCMWAQTIAMYTF